MPFGRRPYRSMYQQDADFISNFIQYTASVILAIRLPEPT
jgi:hypothetical protein